MGAAGPSPTINQPLTLRSCNSFPERRQSDVSPNSHKLMMRAAGGGEGAGLPVGWVLLAERITLKPPNGSVEDEAS